MKTGKLPNDAIARYLDQLPKPTRPTTHIDEAAAAISDVVRAVGNQAFDDGYRQGFQHGIALAKNVQQDLAQGKVELEDVEEKVN